MISIGIYNHLSLYEDLTNDQTNIRKMQVEHLQTLTDLSYLTTFDLLIIHLTNEQVANFPIGELDNTKVIFVSNHFTIEQVKELLFSGAYDCLLFSIPLQEIIRKITKAYTDLMKEKKNKKQHDTYTINAIRESLAYDLLYGNTKNAKEIWERGQLANLPLIPNTVLLLSIDNFSNLVRNKGELWKSSLRKEVLAAINESHIDDASLKVLVNQQKYAILFSLPVQLEENKYKKLAIEYAKKNQEAINKKTAYTVTIGIGNSYEDARNLHLSYEESEQAQTNRLFSRENSIIHIEDIDYFETSEYYTFKIQIQAMTSKFLLGDVAGVHKQWEEIYRKAASHRHLHPEDFRLQVLDLLFSLSKSAMQNGANPKSMMPLQIKYAKELHEIETLVEIDTWMSKIINEFMDHVNEAHNVELLKSIQEILQYMEENYFEEIGLETMAEKVELSPNYLSAIFKQTTGSSFIDYLTELRMKKAKEKLQYLNITIYEVANSIGYSSSQYFSRVFKNNVGMTPSAYRNNVLTTK